MARKSVPAASSDEVTLRLIQEVKTRKAEIATILGKPVWMTNCSFSYVEGRMNEAVNLHVESSIQTLVNIAVFLRDRERGYNEMVAELGVEEPPKFQWGGFTVSEWMADLRARINKIQVAKKQKKLETLEARLNAIITPQLRAQMELEAIASELG
jgi:hypothetical protein